MNYKVLVGRWVVKCFFRGAPRCFGRECCLCAGCFERTNKRTQYSSQQHDVATEYQQGARRCMQHSYMHRPQPCAQPSKNIFVRAELLVI